MGACRGSRVCAGVLAAAGLVSAASRARAADCAVSGYYPNARGREAALLEAGELASNGHWADARAVYLWVLARHDEDPEALFGLARVDAWGGCWAISEAEYRRVLAAHPGDADVRAGYVDLLVWRGRLVEAERLLEEGFGRGTAPQAPALLARAARFAYWRGDAKAAIQLADEAERGAPDDGDIRATRDRMFVGELRLTTHADFYPSNYPSLGSIAAQALQRIGRFEVSGGLQLLERFATDTTTAIYDARYPFDLVYHPGIGALLGAEISPGWPAHAIPDMAVKGWSLVPVVGPLDAFASYSLWHFSGDEFVHIFNPSFGVALPWELRLEARGWISWAILRGQSQAAWALGSQLTWNGASRLSAGVTYTYGAEVDQVPTQQAPTVYQLLQYRSHFAGAFSDVLIDRKFGVRPVVGIQRRGDPSRSAIWIVSLEIGAFARW